MPKTKKEEQKPKAEEIERGSVATSVFISKSIEETAQLSGMVYAALSKVEKEPPEKKEKTKK